MSHEFDEQPAEHDELTIASRSRLTSAPPASSPADAPPTEPAPPASPAPEPVTGAPWMIQQHINRQIDLADELSQRSPTLPLVSIIRIRIHDPQTRRGVASLFTADGSASLMVDVDGAAGLMQLSYSLGSMLTLRFQFADLNSMVRTNWLERLQSDRNDVFFLWGEARWERDYLITVTRVSGGRQVFTSLYAFSRHGLEAAVRLTPDVKKQLVGWLETCWQPDEPGAASSSFPTW